MEVAYKSNSRSIDLVIRVALITKNESTAMLIADTDDANAVVSHSRKIASSLNGVNVRKKNEWRKTMLKIDIARMPCRQLIAPVAGFCSMLMRLFPFAYNEKDIKSW